MGVRCLPITWGDLYDMSYKTHLYSMKWLGLYDLAHKIGGLDGVG